MNKSCSLELRPNQSLLDSSFEGYKLSLEPIKQCEQSFEAGVYVVQPSESQFSFLHVKLFSLNNHLHVNRYNPGNLYFVDKNLDICKIIFSPTTFSVQLEKVFNIPNCNIQSNNNYNISIVFVSPELVVINTGSGSVYFVEIIHQDNSEIWKNLGRVLESESGDGSFLKDARLEITEKNCQVLHILLLCIKEKTEIETRNLKSGLFKTVLIWKGLSLTTNETFVEIYCKKLSIDGCVEYAALEPGCKSIYVVSEKTPQWNFDSEKSTECYNCSNTFDESNSQQIYSWTQNDEEIIFWLSLPTEITKSDLKIVIEDQKLEVRVKDDPLVIGNLCNQINKELSLWSLEQSKLEIHLFKSEEGLIWKNLLCDDDKGEEILDLDNIKDNFGKVVSMQSSENKVFSTLCMQQLEECDSISSDSIALVRIEANSHLITHKVSLSSYPWLFDVHCDPSQAPAICCRLDVDACVWQFRQVEGTDHIWPHEHLGTFFAFGYVQASKTQKKFLACPPNLAYAIVCDSSHHIYIYRHPLPLKSELKNRQTGQKVKTISKQQLINLGTREQIIGVNASDNFLFILLENKICIAAINV